ncbi:MAG: hypothetical protein ABSB60_03505 [Terracidiphilus sp.]|jgi:hypothetical protein
MTHRPQIYYLLTLPTHIYSNSLTREGLGAIEVSGAFLYSAVQYRMFLITFAEVANFKKALGPEMYVRKSETLKVEAQIAEPKSLFGKHLFQILSLS